MVRDFTVKLVRLTMRSPHVTCVDIPLFVKLQEKDGRKISAREYLEDALKPEDGMSEAVESKNAVRDDVLYSDMVLSYFLLSLAGAVAHTQFLSGARLCNHGVLHRTLLQTTIVILCRFDPSLTKRR